MIDVCVDNGRCKSIRTLVGLYKEGDRYLAVKDVPITTAHGVQQEHLVHRTGMFVSAPGDPRGETWEYVQLVGFVTEHTEQEAVKQAA